ncbi:MAG: SLC13 family permease [bacterium]|nr:SLC13 family permease [bacterium]
MSTTVGLIVFLAAIVLAVIIGTKTKCNIGVVGLALAFLIGTMLMGKKITEVIGYFPYKLLFTMMVVTFFYGYASENGAIQGIASRLIYASRKKPWALPIALYIATFVVSAMGAGAAATPVFMSPIAFTLAAQMGFNPMLALLAVFLGSLGGGLQAWTSSGVMFKGIAANTLTEAEASSVSWGYGITLIVACTLFFLLMYVVFKGYKVKAVDIKKPEPFDKKQKITLIIILAMMVLIIVPVFCNMFLPNPVTKWFASKFDIQVLSVIGVIVCSALRLANTADVVKNKIPWTTIIMICGMSTMIGLAVDMGVADVIGSWLGGSIPALLILPMIALLAGLLSFVTTGPAVIFPLFIPMFPALSQATGISVIAMTIALFAGTGATGMSPFSQGGSMALIGCKDDEIREKLLPKQLLCAFAFLAMYLVLAFIGWFKIFG